MHSFGGVRTGFATCGSLPAYIFRYAFCGRSGGVASGSARSGSGETCGKGFDLRAGGGCDGGTTAAHGTSPQYRSGQRSESFGAERREHSGVVQLHPGSGGRSDTFPLPGIPPRCHGHRKHRIHLPGGRASGAAARSRYCLRCTGHDIALRPAGRTAYRCGEKDRAAHGAQYHSFRTALRL